MDALLGAAGLEDIGVQFPDTEARYKDISSLRLLKSVGDKLCLAGYRIENIDATVIAQRPKLAPHIPSMKKSMSNALGVPVSCINLKATTEEGMGFTGLLQGIAAHAVCLIDSK
jgi:2-C-methyl-D-erythritol 2,4-cyclodiphosphate synthase